MHRGSPEWLANPIKYISDVIMGEASWGYANTSGEKGGLEERKK